MEKKVYVCPICGYIHEGENPPKTCPKCKQQPVWVEQE